MKEAQKPCITYYVIRNDNEIYSPHMRVRAPLKYAILYACKRDLIGLSGLNHYVASNWMDLPPGYLKQVGP